MNKLIVSIPIYSISEEKFNKKWSDHHESVMKKLNYKPNRKDLLSVLKSNDFPKTVWKYNKIIGHIEILLSGNDIIFEVYKSNKKKFNYNSITKDFVEGYQSLNNHFYIDEKNNEELKCEIDEMVTEIVHEVFERRTVDYTLYENFRKYFDLKQFIENESY